MRKYINYLSILGVALLVGLTGCEYDQEVEEPISPDTYPVATFSTNFSGNTVKEGDTIKYTITLDKMVDHDLTFEVVQNDGTADDHDYSFNEVTIPAYSTTGTMEIVFVTDDLPEETETVNLEIGVFYVGTRYTLNPSTTNPVLDLTINNYNDPGVITIAFGWENDHNDIDCFMISEIDGNWGAAASSDNPEILTSLWPSDPDGTYYFGIDPYYVETSVVNYNIVIGYPDQSLEYISGVFDPENLDQYTVDLYVTGPETSMDIYRILTLVNNGGNITVTHVNE